MKDCYDLIVIGGGASGLCAAVCAAELGDRVLLLEASDQLGKKIKMSGNGRCNLMNTRDSQYFGDAAFAEAVFSRFTKNDLIDFWYHLGVLLTADDEGRIYPFTFRSDTVLEALKAALKDLHVEILLNHRVTEILPLQDGFRILGTDGQTHHGIRVVLASGGAAQVRNEGIYTGYDLAAKLGLELLPPIPALAPLITDSQAVSGLSGIRVKAALNLMRSGDLIYRNHGEVLFTDYGISGICVMQTARHIEKGNCMIELDFLTPLGMNRETLMTEMIRRKERFPERSPVFLLNGILPSKLSFAVCKQSGLAMKGECIRLLDDKQLKAITESASRYRMKVMGTKGFDMAQVTAGGILCRQVSPITLEVNSIPHLHITGEILNVDGDCGGFNLMFAVATGCLAGICNRKRSVINEKRS